MTKTERIIVSEEAGRGLWLERITPKLSRLVMPNKDQVIFWQMKPIAAYDDGYLYLLEGTVRGAKAAVNKAWADAPVLSVNTPYLDYVIGQALSKAGLMLVRRLDP